MYRLYKDMELTRNIRLRILQWVGRVTRMKDERVPKKSTERIQRREKTVGRPRGRWKGAVVRDVKEDVEMQELEKVGRG